jgi:hypothetical protein
MISNQTKRVTFSDITRDSKIKYFNPVLKNYEVRVPSQWSRVLRHEMSSPAQTLGSSVRIPLEAWMSLSVYSVFALPCVGLITRPRSPTNCL